MSQENANLDGEILGKIEVRAGEGFVKLVVDGGPTCLLSTEEATRLADLLSRAATFAVMHADARRLEEEERG